MKNLILLFLIYSAPAQAGSGDTHISQNYPCIGLDGVPITAGALEQQCCSNGQLISNPPAVCRAGFNSIQSDAAGGAAFNVALAQTTLGVAHDLNGSYNDINHLPSNESNPLTSVDPAHSEASAVQSLGDDGSGSGLSVSGSFKSPLAGSGSKGMAGGAGSGAVAGGVGSLSDGSAGTGLGKDSKQDPNAGEAGKVSGGFVAGNGGSGKEGFGNHDMNYASVDSNAGASGADAEELDFSEDDSATGSNGNVEGTIVDPSNYFALTNKSDDLFKIVSRRYIKKFKRLAQIKPKVTGKVLGNKPI